MTKPTDEFLRRIDDVLERAFPEPAGDVDACGGPGVVEPVDRPVLSTISDERQRQLERLGDPDNESW